MLQQPIQDVADFLECVVPNDLSCVRTRGQQSKEQDPPLLAHYSYSARWAVTDVFFGGDVMMGLLFVAAGKQLQIFDVPQPGG